jgi:hypothetical protein
MKRPLRCTLNWHHWVTKFNEDNEKYVACSRCGKEGRGDNIIMMA